ncbi:bifunctional ADP-dependent NAD(P)H-hydrate dehydratase/NAD(P)H-hydrate epimerase [Sporanaerobium hydrogeniformans]|uniref:Bifunctional ADP-dependent NAD(P)H-hydrate dehydratase/NAD(P)H-hydrate epimerase n=1 Tax=Sporanaerobium hydrogeniformans TaxID=3072179 RepID=A0AC61D920_9FIRM|nr:NAD(P)H-hydrate dehydratase [Sporanaerobium hydrogeniformans]PHV69814.1 bifunctional ADP-dependent NAD(P)H-hydrate dehydratase/NAD(P)H-hydrate epimerase [Sporanaerobium hydrogeniformans]
MKVLVPQQIRELDKRAIEEYAIPSVLLMEHAALCVVERIKALDFAKRIVIVCGPGNNGGDGLAIARLLAGLENRRVDVFLVASPDKLSADGKIYYEIIKKLGVHIISLNEGAEVLLEEYLNKATLIIDALFGTGLTRPIEGKYRKVIEKINEADAYVMSVDCPSGIETEEGKVLGTAVFANETITFVAPKLGLLLYPAFEYTGEVRVVDIGIPKALLEEIKSPYWHIDRLEMRKYLPKRYSRSNKGTYGRVLAIGGQMGMSGAIVLASQAALKVGAGLVTAAVPNSIHQVIECKLTEVMSLPLADKEGQLSEEAIQVLKPLIQKQDIVLIGPGMGRGTGAEKVVFQVLISDKPCVIDADALVLLKNKLELLKNRKAPTILTPHPGELAALTGLTIQEIVDNPIKITKDFASRYHVTMVLKTERTLVVEPTGNVYINTRGNSGMAKGGSGDVLSGVIAGLLAQGLLASASAQLGVYLHSYAGDRVAERKTTYAFLPTDLFEGIEQAFKELIGY